MDPLSCTASILTIIGTAGVVGNGLKKIIALRHAPGILLALNNEVADLYILVQTVDQLIRRHSEATHAGPVGNLCRALQTAEITLFELEDMLRGRLTIKDVDGKPRLDRTAWLRSSTKVAKIKDQIRADRINLTSALSLLTTYILRLILKGVILLTPLGQSPLVWKSKFSNCASRYRR